MHQASVEWRLESGRLVGRKAEGEGGEPERSGLSGARRPTVQGPHLQPTV